MDKDPEDPVPYKSVHIIGLTLASLVYTVAGIEEKEGNHGLTEEG